MITWLAPHDPPEWFPPPEAGARGARRTVRRRRGSASRAADRGLSPRHFPMVFPGTAGAVVVAGSARGALSRGIPRDAQPRQAIRHGGFTLHEDRDFAAVINGCAAPRSRSPGTWITAEMRAAYLALHRLGLAHSYEIWRGGALPAGSTACVWGGCSSGSRCSAARLMPPRRRSPDWSLRSTAWGRDRLPAALGHLRVSAAAPYRAASSWRSSPSGSEARRTTFAAQPRCIAGALCAPIRAPTVTSAHVQRRRDSDGR